LLSHTQDGEATTYIRMAQYLKTIPNLSASITMITALPPFHGACSGCIHVSVPAGPTYRKTAEHVGLPADLDIQAVVCHKRLIALNGL
jgi:hypothetical protein